MAFHLSEAGGCGSTKGEEPGRQEVNRDLKVLTDKQGVKRNRNNSQDTREFGSEASHLLP